MTVTRVRAPVSVEESGLETKASRGVDAGGQQGVPVVWERWHYRSEVGRGRQGGREVGIGVDLRAVGGGGNLWWWGK